MSVTTTVAAYIVTACPADPHTMASYDIRVELVHGFDGDMWAVRWMGRSLSVSGVWSMEPIPSSRTNAWLRGHRFATARHALAAARRAAPDIVVNEVSATQAAARTRP